MSSQGKEQSLTLQVVVHSAKERAPIALSIHHYPLCVTFGLVQNAAETAGEHEDAPTLLADPSSAEEKILSGRLTLILNVHRELCGLHKPGGVPVPPKLILTAAKVGAVKVKELTAILQVRPRLYSRELRPDLI